MLDDGMLNDGPGAETNRRSSSTPASCAACGDTRSATCGTTQNLVLSECCLNSRQPHGSTSWSRGAWSVPEGKTGGTKDTKNKCAACQCICTYLNMYRCVCVYIYIHVYVHAYGYICLCMYIHICIYMCIYIYTCIYIYVCIYIYMCVSVFCSIQSTCRHTRVYIYIYIYMCID